MNKEVSRLKVMVNGEKQCFDEEISIAEMIRHFGIESKRMAVEVNGQVIKRSLWSAHMISENDQIEILEFVGGG